MIITQLFRQFIPGRRPKFKKGDTVQCLESDEVMTVVWVHVSEKTKRITYLCKWFDHRLQTKRTNLFIESQVKALPRYPLAP
jgi:uncharacterized protein YodC (DUF2158 family)